MSQSLLLADGEMARGRKKAPRLCMSHVLACACVMHLHCVVRFVPSLRASHFLFSLPPLFPPLLTCLFACLMRFDTQGRARSWLSMQRCRRNVIPLPLRARALCLSFPSRSLSLSLYTRSSFSFRLTLRLRAIADGSLICVGGSYCAGLMTEPPEESIAPGAFPFVLFVCFAEPCVLADLMKVSR